jgi:hypothetical protein
MAKQYKFRQIINSVTTLSLVEPDYQLLGLVDRVRVIGELDGFIYVEVPDSITLPSSQPVELVEANYKEDKIDAQVVDKIRNRYSVSDEIKLLRTAPSAEATAWNGYVEECRAWGKAQKEMLYVGD